MSGGEQDRAAAIDRSLLHWVENAAGQGLARLDDLDLDRLAVAEGAAVTGGEVTRRWTYLEARNLVKFMGSQQVPRLRMKLTDEGVRCLAECDGDVRAWNALQSPVLNQPITVHSQGGDVQLQVDSPDAVQHQHRTP